MNLQMKNLLIKSGAQEKTQRLEAGKSPKVLNLGCWAQDAGLVLLGVCSLGYFIFDRRFAEWNIQFSFLDFPIFVGEIVLFLCCILLAIQWQTWAQEKKEEGAGFKLTRTGALFFLYMAFVLTKAVIGKIHWGPLAFRDAALFYYPMCVLMGYSFYRKEFFSQWVAVLTISVITAVFLKGYFYNYFLLTVFLLGLVVLKAVPRGFVKWGLLAGFALVTPMAQFFYTSRTMLIGHIVVGVYFALVGLIIFPLRKRYKLLSMVLALGVMGLGVYQKADPNAVKSLTDLKELKSLQKYNEALFQEFKTREKPDYPQAAKLYNPESSRTVSQMASEVVSTEPQLLTSTVEESMPPAVVVGETILPSSHSFLLNSAGIKPPQNMIADQDIASGEAAPFRDDDSLRSIPHPLPASALSAKFDIPSNQDYIPLTVSPPEPVYSIPVPPPQKLPSDERDLADSSPVVKIVAKDLVFHDESIDHSSRLKSAEPEPEAASLRNLSVAKTNIFFRLYIWRDMLEEYSQARPVFGFDFGWPLRSKHLEALRWGAGEWERDGWVGAHNSFLHMIYRAGVVGLAFIVLMFILLGKIISRSIRQKNLAGILLSGILVFWIVAANFLLIFELPYTAIPYWTIFGLTLAHVLKTPGLKA